MSKVKFYASKECAIEGKLYQEGEELPFANKRMIESGLVKSKITDDSEQLDEDVTLEVLTEKSSDVEVQTEEVQTEEQDSDDE